MDSALLSASIATGLDDGIHTTWLVAVLTALGTSMTFLLLRQKEKRAALSMFALAVLLALLWLGQYLLVTHTLKFAEGVQHCSLYIALGALLITSLGSMTAMALKARRHIMTAELIQAERKGQLHEDEQWSKENPLVEGRFIEVLFKTFDINIDKKNGSMLLVVTNTFDKPRTIWASVKYEFYRVDSRTGARTQIASERPGTMLEMVTIPGRGSRELAFSNTPLGEESSAVLSTLIDRESPAANVEVHLFTLIDLAAEPKVVQHVRRLTGTARLYGATR